MITATKKKKNEINFVRIKTINPFKAKYLFLDAQEYLADDIFIKHKFRVKFKSEFSSPDLPYVWIFITVPRSKADLFEVCMAELRNKALIFDYKDYDSVANQITHGLDNKEEV